MCSRCCSIGRSTISLSAIGTPVFSAGDGSALSRHGVEAPVGRRSILLPRRSGCPAVPALGPIRGKKPRAEVRGFSYQERRSVQEGLAFPAQSFPSLPQVRPTERAIAPARRNTAQYFGLS